jgi:hypothetical protein
MDAEYEIDPGTEYYLCRRITLQSDIHIVRITPVSPLGVHHEVLAIDPSPGTDGLSQSDCPPTGPDWVPFFASGVGSGAITMPPNVAYIAKAGQQLVLGLHLFNASTTQKITGKAAIEVAVPNDTSNYQPAGFPYIGNLNFTIGPSLTVTGSCTVSHDTNIFAVFPHMHQHGRHLKIVAAGNTIWDEAFNFNEQKFGFHPNWKGPELVSLKKGDKIQVTCTYDAAAQGVKFGDSSNQEMCFGFAFLYPPIDTIFNSPYCSDTLPF